MNKFLLSILAVIFFCQLSIAQTQVFGYLKGQQNKPLAKASVSIEKESILTTESDMVGYFQFKDMAPGSYTLTVKRQGYDPLTVSFTVTAAEKKKDLGEIKVEYNPSSQDVGIITLTDDELNGDETSSQSGIGLLQSSRDAFSRTAAFDLGGYWFKPRGNENRYNDVLFNGVLMTKLDNGQSDFSNWGGLNDVTRYPYEIAENLNPSEYAFGNLGGVTYYSTRASSFRKGVSLAYSFTNRSYFHRVMATYSTGMMKNGWAFTFSGSRRWVDEGVIDGTYQDAYAYFFAAEKKLSDKHSLNFTAFGSPTRRASNSPNTQEVYDLMGKNYNAYWGWQDGEKRNSRIRKVFEPIFMLTHYWDMGKNTSLNTTISYQFGSDARSRLDWLHASDPTPTYYRNLPSYLMYSLYQDDLNLSDDDWTQIKALQNQWRTGQAETQIDWNNLYYQNSNITPSSTYFGYNLVDKHGNTVTGRRAAYSLVSDVVQDQTANFASHFTTKIYDNWKLNANLNAQHLRSDNFRRVDDLLGADFALNVNSFGNDGKFNVDDPSIVVRKKDRTQYSYDLFRDQIYFNISNIIDLGRWNVVISNFVSYFEAYRQGDYRHHLYLNSSKGKSSKFNDWNMGIKGKITYKITGKDFLVYNGGYFSIAPTLNEIFTNPRVNDLITPNVESQLINSNELSYLHRGQIWKLRLSGYYNTIKNATEINRYYAQLDGQTGSTSQNAFVAEILSGLDKEYIGGELGLEVKLHPTLSVTAVASYGDYKVSNNPHVYAASDSYSDVAYGLIDYGTAYIKNNKVAGTPQEAYSLGIRYNSPKYWWIGVSGNYLGKQYLDFSILNRTANFYTDPTTGNRYDGATPEAVAALLKQKEYDGQFMLNANIGKSFIVGKYRMGISLSVNNILNNRDYVTGGYEQGRAANFADASVEAQLPYARFAPKLWYDRGTNFFANVYLRF